MLRMLSYADVYSQQDTRRMKATEAATYAAYAVVF
jgi:hypothetical protein